MRKLYRDEKGRFVKRLCKCNNDGKYRFEAEGEISGNCDDFIYYAFISDEFEQCPKCEAYYYYKRR